MLERHELEQLLAALRSISGTLDQDEVAHRAVEHAAGVSRAESAVLLLSAGEEDARVLAHHGPGGERCAAFSGAVDESASGRVAELMGRAAGDLFVAAPVGDGASGRGLLAVHSPGRPAPALPDVELAVAAVAEQVGTALSCCRTHRETTAGKDDVFAVLVHELRTLLTPVLNAAQILRQSGASTQMLAQAREIIEQQARHMARLVDDLLDFSRVVRGKVKLDRGRIPVQMVVSNAVSICQPLLESSGQELRLVVPDEPIVVDADPSRLSQVLSNLLGNAAKYGRAGGTVTLSVAREGPAVLVRVKDEGIGVPPEDLNRIFDMFRQTEASRKRGKGLGIGLALARMLTQLHGGAIRAYSDGAGKGSEFVVSLPAAEEPRPPAEPPGARSSSGEDALNETKLKILVVDDNEDSAQSLAMLLELMGNDVRTALTGEAAIAEGADYQPDVVVLDIGLPDIDGYEVARRLRELEATRAALLIALTGWGKEEDRERALEAGFDHHMTKPADPGQLEALLNERASSRV